MACRPKHYREATHDPLPEEHTNRAGGKGASREEIPTDERPLPDQRMLAEEEQGKLDGSGIYLRRLRVLMALRVLAPEDAELVRQVLRGADWFEFDTAAKVRLSKVTRALKRELAQGRRPPAPYGTVRKSV